MTFPVTVHSSQGQFAAALVGSPDVRATAPTREEALAALESAIVQRLDRGELVALEVRRRGLVGLFGKYRDGQVVEALQKKVKSDKTGEEGTWQSFTGKEEVVTSNPASLSDGQEVRATEGKQE